MNEQVKTHVQSFVRKLEVAAPDLDLTSLQVVRTTGGDIRALNLVLAEASGLEVGGLEGGLLQLKQRLGGNLTDSEEDESEVNERKSKKMRVEEKDKEGKEEGKLEAEKEGKGKDKSEEEPKPSTSSTKKVSGFICLSLLY